MLITNKLQIGNNLYRRRKELHLTQFEVAELAELSDRTYADIERGSVNMRVDTLCKICSALKITPDDLLVDGTQNELSFEKINEEIQKCSIRDKEIICCFVAAYLKSIHKI